MVGKHIPTKVYCGKGLERGGGREAKAPIIYTLEVGMKLQRHDIACFQDDITPHNSGEWVKWNDIAKLEASHEKLLEVLKELQECSEYWSEYYVPLGIHERIANAIKAAEATNAG